MFAKTKTEEPRAISAHGAADALFNLARKWIEECDKYHPDCIGDVDDKDTLPVLPSRVIDVGVGQEDKIKLYISRGERARYLTLSHCWGRRDHKCKLSHVDLENWCKEIPQEIIPQTFLDAIQVTRRLGHRYLWIDSVCIIQPTEEDSSDWQVEGSRMADIYRNTYCNILAAAAIDSVSGFLIPRQGIKYPLRDCAIPTNSTSEPYIFFRPRSPGTQGNIYGRGWVYQEQILPARSLHWSAHSLYWQCVTKSAPEMKSNLRTEVQRLKIMKWDVPTMGSIIRNTPLFKDKQKSMTENELRQRMVVEWTSFVKEYTKRKLSVDTDRLVAIAGLASSVAMRAQFAHVRYFAGLWDCMLAELLCWSSDMLSTNTPRRPNGYVAPSWSWASVIGRIVWAHMFDMKFMFSILGVEMKPISDPYGLLEAHGGRLMLKGKLRGDFCGEVELPLCDCCKTEGARDSHEFGPQYCKVIPPEPSTSDISELMWDVFPVRPEESFYCFLFGERNGSGKYEQYALALKRVPLMEDTYQRVGWVRLGYMFSEHFSECEESVITIV